MYLSGYKPNLIFIYPIIFIFFNLRVKLSVYVKERY